LHARLDSAPQSSSLSQDPTPCGAQPERQFPLLFDYVAFEERFRGDEALIRHRQREYLDYFLGKANVLDIGCGRGEFLELLRDHGIAATGIESDPGMFSACQNKGLTVVNQDLFAFLESQPDASWGGIFCSQVIEHLPPGGQFRLVDLVYRKLQDQGVVVVETINPECLYALARNFYLDPTHVRPVHPEMLRFALETCGFLRVELKFSAAAHDRPLPQLTLAEPADSKQFNDALARIQSLLFGFQDYAAIGWR
jgi:SAM-dependent methyltransferase